MSLLGRIFGGEVEPIANWFGGWEHTPERVEMTEPLPWYEGDLYAEPTGDFGSRQVDESPPTFGSWEAPTP